MGTAGNVIVGVGDIYVAPANTALPTNPTTKAGKFTWGQGWTNVGYTEGGVAFEYGPEICEGKVDQELAPVVTILTGEKLTVKTQLAEATAKNLNRAIAASTLTTTAAGQGTAGTDVLEFGSGSLAETMIGFEGDAPGGGRRAIIIYRARSAGNVSLAYNKNELVVLSVEWSALADSTKDAGKRLCKIIDITADAGAEGEPLSIGALYELMLAEYGLDPVAIDRRWTDELFLLMLEKLAERKPREAEAMDPDKPRKVSDRRLFAEMGITPEVVRVK